MLESIYIKNFKGIQQLQIDKLSQLTLIGGKNNCGKSSLMEAMCMLFKRMDPNIIIQQSILRGVNVIPAEPDFMWAPIFNDFDLNKKIEIASTYIGKTKKLEIEVQKNVKRDIPVRTLPINTLQNPLASIADVLYLTFSDDEAISEKSGIYIEQNQGFNLNIEISNSWKPIPVAYFSSRQISNQNEDAERLGRIDINKNINDVLEVMRSIVPEMVSISAIRIANASMIYVDLGKEKKFPISYMGDGIARLLSIVLAIATCKDGIVFIDEIENGLHHSVIKEVWTGIFNASNKFACQIVATTHSHEFLTSACAAMRELQITTPDFSYIRLVSKDENIEAKTFDYELLDYAISSEMEIR